MLTLNIDEGDLAGVVLTITDILVDEQEQEDGSLLMNYNWQVETMPENIPVSFSVDVINEKITAYTHEYMETVVNHLLNQMVAKHEKENMDTKES